MQEQALWYGKRLIGNTSLSEGIYCFYTYPSIGVGRTDCPGTYLGLSNSDPTLYPTPTPMATSLSPGLGRALIGTALVAGTLDITTALSKYYLTTGRSPLNVLRYVASGLWGPQALAGGAGMAVWGLVLHYSIAFLFTTFFFLWLYPRWRPSLHPVLVGVLYGSFVWLVMNMLVVPASRVPAAPFRLGHAAVELLIIIVCIGLPIAFGAHRFYRRQTNVFRSR